MIVHRITAYQSRVLSEFLDLARANGLEASLLPGEYGTQRVTVMASMRGRAVQVVATAVPTTVTGTPGPLGRLTYALRRADGGRETITTALARGVLTASK